MREDQIVAALEAGPHSPSQLRAAIYPEVPSALEWAAERNVTTHLLKLRAEHRAAQVGGRWHLSGAPTIT
jgi:hypothetical protein